MSSWQVVLLEPARVMLAQIGNFLIAVLGVIAILLLGWILSLGIKKGVTGGLRAIGLDKVADRYEFDSVLEKGGIGYSLSELIGVVCYWLGLLITFMVALNAVGLTVAAELLNKVVSYIPNVLSAIFVLIAGIFVATMLKNIVVTSANNAGVSQSKILGKIVEIAIVVFAALIALEQLNIGIRITELTLAIILGTIGLGAALAFGLGCKDIAGKLISDLVDKLKKK